MDQQTVLTKLQPLFRSVFKNDGIEVTRDTVASDISNWDSLNHIRLIAAVEKEFKCKLKLGELQMLSNVGGLVDVLAQKIQ